MYFISSTVTLAFASATLVGAALADTVAPAITRVDNAFMITPQIADDWNHYKALGGSTYAGSPGWQHYTDFLISSAQEFGLVDIDTVDIPYDHYIVNDWPDPATHTYGSGVEVEKFVTDGTPVPVVASYGMTSGFTPAQGITAQMIYYDPANPPTAAQMNGKILVAAAAPYPAAVPGLNGHTPTPPRSSIAMPGAMCPGKTRMPSGLSDMFPCR
jgi:hypothetical protein